MKIVNNHSFSFVQFQAWYIEIDSYSKIIKLVIIVVNYTSFF